MLLQLKDKACVVIGGGPVGTRKVRTLIECGALVTVIGPEISPELHELNRNGKIRWISRNYDEHDLKGMFLAFAATNNPELNSKISSEAGRQHVLCNVADRPEACGFIVPSVIDRGDLIIAVSTSGKSPALSRKLRQEIEKIYGNEYIFLLSILGSVRKKLVGQKSPAANETLFRNLVDSDILEQIRKKDFSGVDRTMGAILGEEFNLKTLFPEGFDCFFRT